MSVTELPVIKQVLESGADDHVYDSLVLAGPLVIAIIILVGRTLVTNGLVILYVATFVSYLLYKAIRG